MAPRHPDKGNEDHRDRRGFGNGGVHHEVINDEVPSAATKPRNWDASVGVKAQPVDPGPIEDEQVRTRVIQQKPGKVEGVVSGDSTDFTESSRSRHYS